jgi:ATP-dependent RNA helicase DeaD
LRSIKIIQLEAFRILGISEETLAALEKKGFHTPSPIQAQAIPILLNSNKDVIGQAQTGTGKTAAFGIPIIEQVDPKNRNVQALVLTPTRELASQVCDEIQSLSSDRKLRVLPVYGGAPIGKQLSALEDGVQIVVGTPGRVMDMINRKKLDLQHLRYAVLDEADEMLNMGFLEDVETILSATNDDKQTLLFSATMPKRIMDLAKRTMGEFELIQVKKEELTASLIDQMYYQVARKDFFEALCRLLDMENDVYGIIFCNTRREVTELSNNLNMRGYKADAIHGDIEQKNREKVIDLFKKKGIKILVATDVAARGIDVSNLSHVFNYGLPQDIESYVHRIGRTGRAGLEGKAISIISQGDVRKLANIERMVKITIDKEKLPDAALMVEIKKERLRHSLNHIYEKGEQAKYLEFADQLLKENEANEIIAALLDHFYQQELDPKYYDSIEESARAAKRVSSNDTRLFVAKGKDDDMHSPKQLISFICGQTGVQAKDIQDIKIFDSFSFFNSPTDVADLIVDIYRMEASKGQKPLVVKAKEESFGGGGGRNRGGFGDGSRGGSRSGGDGGRGDRSGSEGSRGGTSRPPRKKESSESGGGAKRFGDRRDRPRFNDKPKTPGSFPKRSKDATSGGTTAKKKHRGKR